MKKFLAVLMAFCLLAAVVSTGAMAADGAVNAKGEFQIFCVPDANAAAEDDINLYEYIEAGLMYMGASAQPQVDLVVFLGAVITGVTSADDYARSARTMLVPVIAAGVPFAVVFGKHDVVPGLSREELIGIWIAEGQGLCINDPASGDFMYTIKDAAGAAYANLFFFEEGVLGEEEEGEPNTSAEQIAWFEGLNDTAIPAFVFQHIPMAEVFDYMLKTPFNLNLPGSTQVNGNYYYNLPNQIEMIGTVLETPTTARNTADQFKAFVDAGNVHAVFFGNNPRNNYIVAYPDKLLQLVQLPGAAWNGAQGSFLTRGGAFIRIYNNTSGRTYTHDYYTYRQAARLNPDVKDSVFDLWDFLTIFPFAFQNILIALAAPIRAIRGY